MKTPFTLPLFVAGWRLKMKGKEALLQKIRWDDGGIAVFWDIFSGTIDAPPEHLFSKAAEFAENLECKVSAIIFTNRKYDKLEQILGQYGISSAYVVLLSEGDQFRDTTYIYEMKKMIGRLKPGIVLFPSDEISKSIAPRLAVFFNTGITAGCTELKIDTETKKLLQIRPAHQGNIMATIICRHSYPQISTYQGNSKKIAMEILEKKCAIQYQTTDIPKDHVMEIINLFDQEVDEIGGKVVIGMGKGVGSRENARLVFEAARLLNGSVAATREAVRAGWADDSCQIGQTGKKIRPDIYIAFGISGALQHLCGVIAPKCFIAVNHDPAAPIFYGAHIGMIADSGVILKKMIEKLQ